MIVAFYYIRWCELTVWKATGIAITNASDQTMVMITLALVGVLTYWAVIGKQITKNLATNKQKVKSKVIRYHTNGLIC